VPPLQLPDSTRHPSPEALIEVESVRLFLERARAVRPSFEITAANMTAVVAICRQLDGLPLAIELAAARIKVLTAEELAVRLERRLPILVGGPIDLPERQRTLHDTIAWSYDLLTPAEQDLFCRLAVFCGGFTLEAAEAIAAGDDGGQGINGLGGKEYALPAHPLTPLPPVLDGVASLVDKSLLHLTDQDGDDRRYRMLETVREFALEQLEESGQARAVKTRHAFWYLDRAERLWTAIIRGPTHVPWLSWAETEHDNLGAALAWFDESGDAEHLLMMVGSIWPFWMIRNHLTEWMNWVERSLPLADQVPLAVRARFLQSASAQYLHYPILDRRHVYLRALAAFEELGDEWGVGTALHQGGSQALAEGRYDEAGALLGRAIEIFEGLSVADWFAFDLSRIGEVALGKGDLAGARRILERSLELNLAMDEPWVAATNLNNLALIALEEHRHGEAVERMTMALSQLRRTRDVAGLASWLALAAMIASEDRRYELAARLFGTRAETMSRQDLIPKLPQRAIYERAISSLRQHLGVPAFESVFEAGRRADLDEAIQLAESALAGGRLESERQERRPGGLTEREVAILELLAGGSSNHEIADALSISIRTVERHIGNIYLKIGAHNRAEATAFAFRQGIAPDSST
jgi:predicted ATPase/DNA-binding CsgD family transcriptional regulator